MTGGRLRIGPWRLESLVARGGMGEVWRASHGPTGTPVAVKVVASDASRDPFFQDAFRNEVRLVAALDHPNVVAVHDQGSVPDDVGPDGPAARGPYVVMEWADGGTLGRPAPASWAELRGALVSVLDALGAAHARGIVHRDVKPPNVLRMADGTWRLADFGVASRVLDGAMLVPTGTPGYMAPELIRPAPGLLGPWTDLYGLACVAWELASGRRPFRGPEALEGHLARDPPPFEARFDVPADLASWLLVGLAKRPEDRWRCAAEAAASLPSADPSATPRTAGRRGDGAKRTPFRGTWEQPPSRPRPLATAGPSLWGLRSVPLVGRVAERDRLWAALGAAQDGPAAVVLAGPAGCGKTRLAEWLAHRAHEAGAAVWLRASHAERPAAGDGLVPMVARHLGVGGLGRDEAVRALGRTLDERDAAGLADALDPSFGGADGGRARNALLLRAIGRACGPRCALLWLDDLQWGEEAILFALQALEGHDARLLVVGTVREEALAERPGVAAALARLQRSARTTTVRVAPLEGADHAALVDGLVRLDPPLAAEVCRRTAGNPMFAVQVVGDWVEHDALVPGPDGHRLRDGVALPADLDALWVARLDDALAARPEVAASLEVAAVLGSEVDGAEWRAACEAAAVPARPDVVEALLARGLARSGPEGPGVRWWFVHPQLAEGLVRRASAGGRLAAWHLACAGAARGLGRRGAHLFAAGRFAEAVEPLTTAAALAAGHGADLQSAAHAAMAVEALERSGAPWDDPAWATVEIQRIEAAASRGRLEEAEAACVAILAREALPGWSAPVARALRWLGWLADLQGRRDEAVALLLRAEALGNAVEARVARLFRARLQAQVGRLAEAEALFREVADGGSWPAAEAAQHLGGVLRQAGRLDEARAWLERALERYQALGRRAQLADVWNGLGDVARAAGDLDEAQRRYEEALTVHELVGSLDAPVIRLNVAMVHLLRGRALEAAPYVAEAATSFAAQGRSAFEAATAVLAAWAASRTRDWAGFDAALARAEPVLAATGFVESDVALAAERAGAVAEAEGERARAARAYALAAGQWAGVGREAERARASSAAARCRT